MRELKKEKENNNILPQVDAGYTQINPRVSAKTRGKM
jgi:hypothetical protein